MIQAIIAIKLNELTLLLMLVLPITYIVIFQKYKWRADLLAKQQMIVFGVSIFLGLVSIIQLFSAEESSAEAVILRVNHICAALLSLMVVAIVSKAHKIMNSPPQIFSPQQQSQREKTSETAKSIASDEDEQKVAANE